MVENITDNFQSDTSDAIFSKVEDRHILPLPEEAPVVLYMFQQYAQRHLQDKQAVHTVQGLRYVTIEQIQRHLNI